MFDQSRPMQRDGGTGARKKSANRPTLRPTLSPDDLVAIYCRVSTEEQQQTQTIRNQVAYAQRWVELNGLRVHDWYLDDGVSGTIPLRHRPAGARLLADAREVRFGAVLVYRLDRFGRALRVILDGVAQLEEDGVTLRSMTEPFDTATPIGRFVLQLLGSLAELEKETIVERSRLGKVRASREGIWAPGKAALGYRRQDRRLVIDEDGAAIVRRIFSLYLDDRLTTQQIAQLLNAEGVPTPGRARAGRNGRELPGQSGRWTESRVARVLGNPIYFGHGRFTVNGGAEVVEISVPPIVSEEQFEQVARLKQERTLDARRNAKYFYLLRGRITCGHCGGAYMGNEKQGRRYYRCWRRGTCPESRALRGEDIEVEVWADIRAFVHTPGKVLEQLQARLATEVGQDRDAAAELAQLERRLAENDEERQRLLRAYRKGMLREGDLEAQLREVEQARLAWEDQQRRLLGQQARARRREEELLSIEGLLDSLAGRIEEIEAGLRSDDLERQARAQEQQREITKLLVNQISVRWASGIPEVEVEYTFTSEQGAIAPHSLGRTG